MRKDFEAAFSRSSHGRLATCEQVHYSSRAERLESTFLSSSSQSPNVAASVLLHNMHRLSCDLPQDNQP